MTCNLQPLLILGSTGCVGRSLAAVWPAEVPVLWQHRPGTDAPPAPTIAWDILNTAPPALPDLGGIVLLAGVTDRDPWNHNAALARSACDLAAARGLRVLIASSQAVYGAAAGLGRGDLTEDQARATPGSYGAAKLAMEAAVADHPHADACCLRIANVIGCDMLLKTAATGSVALDRFADGTSPQRQYVGPVTLARVLWRLMAHDGALPPVMNIAQPGVIAMHELVDAAAVPFAWQAAPARALPRMTLDLTRQAGLVPLPPATPAGLIAEARAGGWRPAP